MHAPIVRTILTLCVCFALSYPASAQRIGSNSKERAQYLLGQIETQLAKIRNFRCQKVTPEIVLPGTDKQVIMGYERVWLASDQQGRGRVRTASGQIVDTQIWDGVKTIEYRQELASDGSVTHTVFAARGQHYDTQRHEEPWVYLGRGLANLLTNALDDGRRIRVTQASDKQFRVDIHDNAGNRHSYIVDPQKGYAPVYHRITVNGEVQSVETTTFLEVRPGIWFPANVQSQAGLPDRPTPETWVPKCRFSDVILNDDWSFRSALKVEFAEGTEVRDRSSGQVYVVGEEPLAFLANPAPTEAIETSVQPEPNATTWRAAFEAAYGLEDGQAIKCISPPFVPERAQYLQEAASDGTERSDAGHRNQYYRFVWDDALEGHEILGPDRPLPLATIIERVIGLTSYKYEGPAHVLRLRLAGDWVVRKDAPTEQLLAALEQIVQDQTQSSIGFTQQRVDAIVVRSSGTYRFTPQSGITGTDGVHIYAGHWSIQPDALGADSDCGTVAGLLDHVADSIGMPIIDGTQSTNVQVCWATHGSSQLRDQRSVSSIYNRQVASLLNNLTNQTGLTFSMELGSVVQWHVSTQRSLTARSN